MPAFPYHPVVYHLDLCTLAYQLHSQSLKWPLDPYYEGIGKLGLRDEFMASVRKSDPKRYPDNRLDPIECDYEKINPHYACFVRPSPGKWILYNTPKVITNKIGTLAKPGFGPETIGDGHGLDEIYCFEGFTGAKLAKKIRESRPGQASLLGFVLKRYHGNGTDFDLHIVFRGSRSGELRLYESQRGSGNPDWVTDLKEKTKEGYVIPQITQTGAIANGFASSMFHSLPNILECIQNALKSNIEGLKNIYVTGHSLGGALAVTFATAIGLGTYNLPQILKDIAKAGKLQVITYGSPPIGNVDFKNAFGLAPIPVRRYLLEGDIVTDGKNGKNAPTIKTKVVTGVSVIVTNVGKNFHVGAYLVMPFPFPEEQREVGDPHEPMWIRKGLLRAISGSNKELHPNIPFNNIDKHQQDKDNPWRCFDSFHDLKTNHGLDENLFQNRLGDFEECRDNIVAYLDHLISCLEAKTYKGIVKEDLITFKNAIRRVTVASEINTCFSAFCDLYRKKEKKLIRILKDCTLMLLLSFPPSDVESELPKILAK